MPGLSILKLFTLFGIVSAWSEKALKDQKITLSEAAELAESLAPLLGVPVDVHIPFPVTPQLKPPGLEDTLEPELEFPEDSVIENRPAPRT